MQGPSSLVEVRHLKKIFGVRRSGARSHPSPGGIPVQVVGVRAVDDVSFSLASGEILGVVGESGSGKSTVARLVVRLEEPTDGEILFEGRDVLGMSRKELRAFRVRFQMVFQDPYSSLNPRMTVGAMLEEALRVHRLCERKDMARRVADILRMVELSPAMESRFPVHLSGGQRQRVAIARALAVGPKLVVADEPTSSLDVSVQAQLLNLVMHIRNELGTSWIFISHNLNVVHYVADRIMVMYLGRVVEQGPAQRVLESPLHPYTRDLLASVPDPDPSQRLGSAPLQGDPPSPSAIPIGCRFVSRCPIARPFCETHDPMLTEAAGGHQVACWAVVGPEPWADNSTLVSST